MDLVWLLMVVVGIAAGIISGLIGVGGGIVLTPFLHYGLGMAWSDAVALSLWVIAIQSPIGIQQHRARGAVSWRLGLLLAAGGTGGVLLGDWLLPQIAVTWLKLSFAALLGLAALRLTRRDEAYPERLDASWIVLLIGFAAGIVSRLLGVGGGILTVPALALLGVPVHLAVGSSLVPVFTNAALASGINLARGLDWVGGVLLAVGAIAGAVAGVRIAHRLRPERLRGVVGAAMAAAAFAIAFEATRNGL